MNVRRLASRLAVVSTAAALVTSAVAVPAQAALGTKSLASVLYANQSGFDTNPHDYDILRNAIKTTLKVKPNSPVKVLADGNVALTAFLPSDAAFQELVRDITGAKKAPSERAAYNAVAALGIPTVERVLLYHVVPGATITKAAALKSDDVRLKTANGQTFRVDITSYVSLVDADQTDRNPRLISFDINAGNKQIAHGIDRVLRPINLP